MTAPRMIFFDYGGTLAHEGDFDSARGFEAALNFAVENPRSMTARDLDETASQLWSDISENGRILEISEPHFWRFLFESCGIRLTVTLDELEGIFWNASSTPTPTPGCAEMLACLRRNGIRTGVISNLCFSGSALKARLGRLFPEHEFELVLTSADCVFRKPSRAMFDAAAKMSGLSAGEIWFAGDNYEADVAGASRVGMFPVYIGSEPTPENAARHLRIGDWGEMTALLEAK